MKEPAGSGLFLHLGCAMTLTSLSATPARQADDNDPPYLSWSCHVRDRL